MFIYVGVVDGWEEDEMFLVVDLDVDVFVVVFVEGGGGVLVFYLEVDCVGVLVEGYLGEGDGGEVVGE